MIEMHGRTKTAFGGPRRAVAWLLSVVAAAGCAAQAKNNPPPATAAATDDDDVAALFEHHGYHHHGGVTLFIAMSLETLGVSPEQRAVVEQIRDGLYANMEGARKAEQELVMSLVDGLRASKFDSGKVDGVLVKVTAAAAQVDTASAGALNQLHAALTPPQRAALVDKVEAHWAVWRRVNDEETAPGDRRAIQLSALETDLALTPDQIAQINAALGDDMKSVPQLDHARVSAHLRAFGTAFRAESFDANAMTTGHAADEQLVRWGAVHLVHVIETMGTVLNAEQRSELAQMLNVHATHELATRSNS